MKFLTKTMIASAILVAGAAFAEVEPTTPEVIARQDLMKSFGGAAKALGGMAKGEVAYDAAAAETAKQTLIAGAAEIEAKFKANVEDAGSEALPAVWEKWDDFLADAKALGDAATALDIASAETIGAGMGAIGGTCKDCHTEFRKAN
jgi:cytochrome c556